ncbi:hypothetical protein GCM10010961_21430 [Pseudodonghicola xiamenensis]|uniref:Uncharacterized protein n=1 Tax=Pseudodonghicola xiamenensis TaxID=337702 RepID=A0A8J3H5V6_9RHOB|nr:hypothetical protein GCM10010961_21430 [Pseudodonghicola xiamenensis]
MKNEYIAAGGVVIAAIIGAVALYLSSGAPPASQHIEIRTYSHDQATNNTQIHITPSDPLDALTATFTRDKNPLTQIACTLACLPFPYDIQDSQDGTLEVYTSGYSRRDDQGRNPDRPRCRRQDNRTPRDRPRLCLCTL